MSSKTVVFLGLTCVLAFGIHVARATDGVLDWSQIELGIAMTRNAPLPQCLTNAQIASGYRGSRVFLTLPEGFQNQGFQDIVRKKLGGKVGKAYFRVFSHDVYSDGEVRILFDFNKVKEEIVGQHYYHSYERSSNFGNVKGDRCVSLKKTGSLWNYPAKFSLDYVQFDSPDGTKSVRLYPQGTLMATSTTRKQFAARGPYVKKPVKVPDWAN